MDLKNRSQPNGSSSNHVTPSAKLLPVPVLPYAPVRQDERQHYLKLLHTQYALCHEKIHGQDSSQQNSASARNELVTRCVKKEYEIAKTCKNKLTYQHTIKKLMFNLKKFGTEDGRPRGSSKAGAEASKNTDTNTSTSTGSGAKNGDDAIFAELRNLCVPLQRLKRHGYVTDYPLPPNPEYELPATINCSHCGISFKIQDIASTVSCHFHPGKLQTSTYNGLNKGKKIYGTDYMNQSYSCCNETKGQSSGCKILTHHVYKFNTPIDLHLSKKFQKIDDLRFSLNIKNDSKAQLLRKVKIKAIGIDCEMCYTDRGFEMMKLSVIDFTTEKKLIDSIVHPDGELIIDLNSHVSGVTDIPPDSLSFDEILIKLAQFTDNDTIIVGHGLENDLNVLRLIYRNVVDTAILFSENKIDVRRKDPLKKLAWTYLSENIQGQEHDSLEDAIIPVRIVKKHIEKLLSKRNKRP